MSKILLVEDSVEVSQNLYDLLVMNGHETYLAENGKDGYYKAKEVLPDLIISDIMMPEMDGYELLNLIRADEILSTTLFVFLTAKSSYNNLRRGMNYGADDYIAKPYSIKEIITSINMLLAKKDKINKRLESLKNNISMYIPHELRTPLTGIIGFTEMLEDEMKEKCENEKAGHFLKSIKHSAKRLKDVVNKFIFYSETELILKDNERLEILKRQTVESTLEIITQSSINAATKYNRKDDLRICVDDATIHFDEVYLNFIVYELIENACKYSQKGKEIDVVAKEENGKYLITVMDYGLGIKPENIPQISAFQQFDREKYEIGGNGLGMVSIKKLLKVFNSELEIKSELNKFTRVSISIRTKNINS